MSPEAAAVVRTQIRGSALLVSGRLLSAALTLVAQVVIVRHLSTEDYGAWAYALTIVMFWQALSTLGFQDAISRFVPMYLQKRDYSRLLGTIVLAAGVVLLFSVAVIVAFFAAPQTVLALVQGRSESLAVLFVLIFLIPLEALDVLLVSVFASLVNARAIFFRRYIVAPGFRLGVVLVMAALGADVIFLAYGYLAASLLGIGIYGVVLLRQLHREGLLAHLRHIRVPARQVLSFSVPMMTSEMLISVMQTVVVVLLGYYHGIRDVALFRVVLPIAGINEIMSLTAAVLYLPAASRLLAQGDLEGVRHLYWRTALWMAVLSFPLFVLTFGFANPLTEFLYGERYAEAGTLLAILSVSYYVKLVFGFNGLTVKAMNKIGAVVTYNVLTAIVNVVLSFLLIPAYGALGAALAVGASVLSYTLFKQVALSWATGISTFDRRHLSFYLLLAAAGASQFLVFRLAQVNMYVALLVAVLCVLGMLLVGRRKLEIAEVFPESARIPVLRWFAA